MVLSTWHDRAGLETVRRRTSVKFSAELGHVASDAERCDAPAASPGGGGEPPAPMVTTHRSEDGHRQDQRSGRDRSGRHDDSRSGPHGRDRGSESLLPAAAAAVGLVPYLHGPDPGQARRSDRVLRHAARRGHGGPDPLRRVRPGPPVHPPDVSRSTTRSIARPATSPASATCRTTPTCTTSTPIPTAARSSPSPTSTSAISSTTSGTAASCATGAPASATR